MQSVKVGRSAASTARRSFPIPVGVSAHCRRYNPAGQTRGAADASEGEAAVIRVPRYVQKRVDSVKQVRDKNKMNTLRAGKLLVQGKNPGRNQSSGYAFGKFEQPTLCSRGWKHRKSFGDYFSINNVKAVAPFVVDRREEGGEQKTSFDNLRVCGTLVEALRGMDVARPTSVQLQTIPKVMRGHNVLVAAETGSGKTLCYLLPAVNKLQAEKASEVGGQAEGNIRTVVLVPSRELADQVAAVARKLCAPFNLMTRTVGGGRGVGHIKRAFKGRQPDILVATPGALVKALRRRCLDFSELSFFVVDEADTMFDPSFSPMLEDILLHAKIARNPKETRGPGHKAQLLVVGATFPGGVGEVLGQVTDLGSVVLVKSKMLHFLMPHVKQTFVKIKVADKILELHEALRVQRQEKNGGAALVFCNKSSTVNWLGYSLDEMGVRHARLQGEMPAAVRSGVFHSFQEGKVDVLVCTDIASRGLDTSRAGLVVNYDCPESPTDYIHRAGRVGRAGGVEDVKVLSFVSHPWDVELVQKIETAARRRTSLPGMRSQIHEPKPKVAEE
ncbi:probable ATP-dependent RNA helicase DDX28 [Brachionichthys hirsutus]|uniref:probable ATP-dependent RNA helicase DDX28 n=1 Tax=Brachionichthys hirsutus TaxID=412623 RepID=UPI0036046DC0